MIPLIPYPPEVFFHIRTMNWIDTENFVRTIFEVGNKVVPDERHLARMMAFEKEAARHA